MLFTYNDTQVCVVVLIEYAYFNEIYRKDRIGLQISPSHFLIKINLRKFYFFLITLISICAFVSVTPNAQLKSGNVFSNLKLLSILAFNDLIVGQFMAISLHVPVNLWVLLIPVECFSSSSLSYSFYSQLLPKPIPLASQAWFCARGKDYGNQIYEITLYMDEKHPKICYNIQSNDHELSDDVIKCKYIDTTLVNFYNDMIMRRYSPCI